VKHAHYILIKNQTASETNNLDRESGRQSWWTVFHM